MQPTVNAVQAQRLFPHVVDIKFFIGGDEVVDVDDDALVRPRHDAAAVYVDDIGQGAGGGPGRNHVVVVGPSVVGDADLDVRMPLHKAFIVLGLARAESRFPVATEGQLDLVLGAGDTAQRTQPGERNAGTAGGCELQKCPA